MRRAAPVRECGAQLVAHLNGIEVADNRDDQTVGANVVLVIIEKIAVAKAGKRRLVAIDWCAVRVIAKQPCVAIDWR